MRILSLVLVASVLLSGCLVGEKRPEGDSDGDYLLDELEQAGWDLDLELDTVPCADAGEHVRHAVTVHVNSSEFLADTDYDGVDDAEEYAFHSNPRNNDTDGDGLSDAVERDLNYGETIKLGGALKLTKVDSDDDCLGDANETRGYRLPAYGLRKTDPTLVDTDEDGLADGREAFVLGTDPADPDTDDDGMNDFIDADPTHNLGLRLVFDRFTLKTGAGPVHFHSTLDDPDHPVADSAAFSIAQGENKSVPAAYSRGDTDVQDVDRLTFQFWVTREDGSVLDIVPGSGQSIVSGEADREASRWSAMGQSGATGQVAWFVGSDGEIAFRIEVVHLSP